MSQKTEQFKNTQIPLWEDGDLANGANFSQLITAIATLIDETKTETLDEASRADSGYTDEAAKAVVKAFLSSNSDYSTTTLYTTLKSLIDGKLDKAAFNAEINKDATITQIKNSINSKVESGFVPTAIKNELMKNKIFSVVSYVFTANNKTVTLHKLDGTSENHVLTGGWNFVQETGPRPYLKAEAMNVAGTLYLLTRLDGAKVVLDTAAKTVKPAAVLIG